MRGRKGEKSLGLLFNGFKECEANSVYCDKANRATRGGGRGCRSRARCSPHGTRSPAQPSPIISSSTVALSPSPLVFLFFFLSGSLFFLPLLNSCSLSPIPCVALYVLPRLQESESRSLSPRQRLLCVNICQMSGVLMGPCHLQSGQCVLSSVRVERACGCSSYNV